MINILLLALIACGDEEKEDTATSEVIEDTAVVEETEEQFIVPPKTMNKQVMGVPCVEK